MEKSDIERKLRIEMRKNSGSNFSDWVYGLSSEELEVFSEIWHRDSKRKVAKKTIRLIK